MHIEKLTVADAMERNILFCDSEADAACRVICQREGTSCLPDLSGQQYWLYNGADTAFTAHPIRKEQRIKSRHFLIGANLDGRLMDALERILFVYDEEWLVGLLTVADLYRPVVMQAFQRDLSDFGQLLRRLLLLAGKTDGDMLTFLQAQAADKEQLDRIEKISRRLDPYKRIVLPSFAHFTTAELLAYARSADSGSVYEGYDADVAGERAFERINEIMHQVKQAIDCPGSLTDHSPDGLGLFRDVMQFRDEYNHLRDAVLTHSESIRSRQERNWKALEQRRLSGLLPDVGLLYP